MPEPSEELVTAKISFKLFDTVVQAEIPVPAGPTRVRVLLPMVQALADLVVGQAVKAVETQGEKVRCRKGCGACCRQLVPITAVEARRLRDLVDEMPEPRRSIIRARFAEARVRLEQSGLLDKLLHPEALPVGTQRPLGLEYFQLHIACPFLEDESCSIYAERPIACREYLVTSSPVHCTQPSAETVKCVPLPGKVSNALACVDEAATAHSVRWVPLVVAPEWAETHPEEPAPRPGPVLLRELFEGLAGKKIE